MTNSTGQHFKVHCSLDHAHVCVLYISTLLVKELIIFEEVGHIPFIIHRCVLGLSSIQPIKGLSLIPFKSLLCMYRANCYKNSCYIPAPLLRDRYVVSQSSVPSTTPLTELLSTCTYLEPMRRRAVIHHCVMRRLRSMAHVVKVIFLINNHSD